MVELHIKIRKRIARLAYGENFVSYNEGYKIIFDFDKEWDSIENKTARFIFGENYIDYPFNGNEVEIPLIKNADTLEIGVYSDNLYTTTAVKFKILKSIKDEEKIEILVPEAYPEIEELDDEDLIRVYDKSEEKIGISPLKKLFDKMGVAIDDALTQAKESGEFDGADGITPTIGENGNWYLGDTDTNKPSRGEKGETGARGEKGATGATGATGADGKSAYSYAVDGGYTGTEAEFAAKLAAESIDKALFVVNITSNGDGTYSADKTFEEITQAYNEGKYSIVAIMALRTGNHIMPLLAAQKTGAVFGMVLGQTRFSFVITSNNEVQREMIQLATLNSKLPNPYPLTFTGAVNETYDGSSAKTIKIPSGGGGSGSYFGVYTVEEDVSQYRIPFEVSRYRRIVIGVNQPSNQASLTIGFVIDGLVGSTAKEGGVSSRTYFMFDVIEWTPGTLTNGGKYEILGYSRRNNNPSASVLLKADVQYVTTEENSLIVSGNDGVVIPQGSIITITATP